MADDEDSNSGEGEGEPTGTGLYITQLGPFDVLLGRGTGPSMHEGNIRFRQIVEELKPSYVSTTSRKAKKNLVRKIVNTIKAENGRFLMKLHKSETRILGLDAAAYEIVRDSVAFEKTKQAIRYVHYKKEPAAARSPNLSSKQSNEKKIMTKKKESAVSNSADFNNQMKPTPATNAAATNPSRNTSASSLTSTASMQLVLSQQSGKVSATDAPSMATSRENALSFSPPDPASSVTTTRLQDLLFGTMPARSPPDGGSIRPGNEFRSSVASVMSIVDMFYQNQTTMTTIPTRDLPFHSSPLATSSFNPDLDTILLRERLTALLSGSGNSTQGGWFSLSEQADSKRSLFANQRTNSALPTSILDQRLQAEAQRQLILASSGHLLSMASSDLDQYSRQQSSVQALLMATAGFPHHDGSPPFRSAMSEVASQQQSLMDDQRLQPLFMTTRPTTSSTANETLEATNQQQDQQQQRQRQQAQEVAILLAEEERRRIIESYFASLAPK